MPAIYTFSRSNLEIEQELMRVFSYGRGNAQEQWAVQAELLVEPVGWDALWKLSKTFCVKLDARMPCIALVSVTSVDFEKLCANVDVHSVQTELMSLPEKVVQVPLIELFPTKKQREKSINVATTAEFIDLLRFYYNHIWMPWDDADDKLLLPNTIHERMQLWAEMNNGAVPPCMARQITLLRNSAIHAYEKIRDADSSLCEDDLENDNDDIFYPPEFIALNAEMTSRIDEVMAKWSLFETEFIRTQYIAKEIVKYQKYTKGYQVVVLWEGGTISELDEITKFLTKFVNEEYRLCMMTSAEDAFGLEPEELVICGKRYLFPEVALSNISITSLSEAIIETTGIRSCLLVLSGECRLRNMRLLCSLVNTVVAMRIGSLHVINCDIRELLTDGQDDVAQGIVAMDGAKILVENSTFESLYTGVVVHKGAEVVLRNCIIKKCGVGVQMYSGAKVELHSTVINDCFEQCVRCEIALEFEPSDKNHTYVNGVEGLIIHDNCKIGSGDLQKEVIVVKQDIEI